MKAQRMIVLALGISFGIGDSIPAGAQSNLPPAQISPPADLAEATAALHEFRTTFTDLANSIPQGSEEERVVSVFFSDAQKQVNEFLNPNNYKIAVLNLQKTLQIADFQLKSASAGNPGKLTAILKALNRDLENTISPETASKIRIRRKNRAPADTLAEIRSAISAFFMENAGRYPKDVSELTSKTKLARIPKIEMPGHESSSSVRVLVKVKDLADLESQMKDTGQLAYIVDPNSPFYGHIVIDCTHPDSNGTKWFKE